MPRPERGLPCFWLCVGLSGVRGFSLSPHHFAPAAPPFDRGTSPARPGGSWHHWGLGCPGVRGASQCAGHAAGSVGALAPPARRSCWARHPLGSQPLLLQAPRKPQEGASALVLAGSCQGCPLFPCPQTSQAPPCVPKLQHKGLFPQGLRACGEDGIWP